MPPKIPELLTSRASLTPEYTRQFVHWKIPAPFLNLMIFAVTPRPQQFLIHRDGVFHSHIFAPETCHETRWNWSGVDQKYEKIGKKRGASEKVSNEKKEGWSQLRPFWFAMIRRTFPVFSYLLFFFFNLFPFSFFLLQSYVFLILGSTNLRRSYPSFSTHRLYDLISCACAVACIVLGPCNQLNPICQATAISSMASQIQWQQQSLSSQGWTMMNNTPSKGPRWWIKRSI